MIPSHQGCPSKLAAKLQVRPPRNGETARCGRRRWTSIRRARSQQKRSRDKRLCSSALSQERDLKCAESWESNPSSFCFILRQFMNCTGESRTSSKIFNLPERLVEYLSKNRRIQHFSLISASFLLKLLLLCLGVPRSDAKAFYHDGGGAGSHLWRLGCIYPSTRRWALANLDIKLEAVCFSLTNVSLFFSLSFFNILQSYWWSWRRELALMEQ